MKRFSLLAAAFLLSGCVSIGEHWYTPQAEGGKLKEANCGFTSGPGRWSIIEFVREGMKIRATAHQRPQGFSANLTLWVPIGTTLVFEDPTAKLVILPSNRELNIKTDTYSWVQDNPITIIHEDIKQPLVGRKSGFGGNEPETYGVAFNNVGLPAPDKFIVEFPAMRLDGRPIKLPQILFTGGRHTYPLPLNC